jgi:hypothetical protein
MHTIRTTAAAIISSAALTVGGGAAGAAEHYPWCAIVNVGPAMSTNCGFTSYQQCEQTVRGQGGYCQQNPDYKADAARSDPRKSRR